MLCLATANHDLKKIKNALFSKFLNRSFFAKHKFYSKLFFYVLIAKYTVWISG